MLAWKSPMHRHKQEFQESFRLEQKIACWFSVRLDLSWNSWRVFPVYRYSFKIFPGLKVTGKTFLPRRPHIEPLRRKDPGHSSARCKNLRNEIANWCKLPSESHHWNHEIGCVEPKLILANDVIRISPESRQHRRLHPFMASYKPIWPWIANQPRIILQLTIHICVPGRRPAMIAESGCPWQFATPTGSRACTWAQDQPVKRHPGKGSVGARSRELRGSHRGCLKFPLKGG